MNIPHFVYSTTDGCLSCFQLPAILDEAATNVLIRTFWRRSFIFPPESGFAGS